MYTETRGPCNIRQSFNLTVTFSVLQNPILEHNRGEQAQQYSQPLQYNQTPLIYNLLASAKAFLPVLNSSSIVPSHNGIDVFGLPSIRFPSVVVKFHIKDMRRYSLTSSHHAASPTRDNTRSHNGKKVVGLLLFRFY